MRQSGLLAIAALLVASPVLAQSAHPAQPMVYFNDLIRKPEVASALKQQLSAEAMKAAKTYATSGVNTPLTQSGALRTAFACKPHYCDTDSVTIAFDQSGTVWSAYAKGGKVQVFGNPPPDVRAALTAK